VTTDGLVADVLEFRIILVFVIGRDQAIEAVPVRSQFLFLKASAKGRVNLVGCAVMEVLGPIVATIVWFILLVLNRLELGLHGGFLLRLGSLSVREEAILFLREGCLLLTMWIDYSSEGILLLFPATGALVVSVSAIG
jgi:hypothetical protein